MTNVTDSAAVTQMAHAWRDRPRNLPLRKAWFALVAGPWLLAGCASIAPPPMGDVVDRHGVDVVIEPPSSVGVYLKDSDSTERFCRGPGPDSSVSTSQGIGLSIPEALGGEGIQEGVSSGSASLGGRNPEVLIARELLYRACELSMNLDADQETTLNIYEMALDAIREIAKYQTQEGAAATVAGPQQQSSGSGGDGSGSGGDGSESGNSGGGATPKPCSPEDDFKGCKF